MADRFRLLRTGFNNAWFNMGLDEAILGSVAEGKSLPALRLYGWKPAAISIGYFQGMREEIDVEACASQGVDIVRRITGGGAVFHDCEFTYSLAIPEGHRLAPRSIQDSYHLLCDGIVQGLARLGIRAEFAPINDIVSGGKKVSGNAQTRKRGCLLQHGTILLEVDVEKMFSLLKVPKEKALGKMIEDVKARVTSVSALLGRPVGFEEAEAAILAGFVSSLGIECIREEASAQELRTAQSLAKDRFSTPEWLFKR